MTVLQNGDFDRRRRDKYKSHSRHGPLDLRLTRSETITAEPGVHPQSFRDGLWTRGWQLAVFLLTFVFVDIELLGNFFF